MPLMTIPFSTQAAPSETDIAAALAVAHTQTGNTLGGLSEQGPVLLIFLRQFG